MTLLTNSFEGGTLGVALTPANSGGASGNAFSAVSIPAGGGNLVFDSAQAAHGGLSLKATPGPTAVNSFWYTVGGSNEIAMRGYFYFTAAPATGLVFYQIGPTSGRTVSLQTQANGKMRVQDATGTGGVYTSATNFPLNQWIRIELHVKVGTTTTNGSIDYALYAADSMTPLDSYSSAAVNTGTVPLALARWGAYQSSNDTTPFWVDDVAFSDTATSFIGPVGLAPAAATVRPNGVTANPGAWTNEGSAATLPAALADESDTTFLQTPENPAGASVTVTHPALQAGDVTVKVRHQASAASPTISRKYELLQGTTVITSKTVTLPTAWTDYQFTTTTAETSAITDRTALALRVTDTAQ